MIKIKVNLDLKKELEKASKVQTTLRLKQILEVLKDATPVDTGNARDSWVLEGNTIVNRAEYIDRLNKGSSKQAPSYFIEKALLTQPDIVPSGTIVRSL